MKICGFNNSTDAGPDHFGCSVFLKGCNLRCPYCMNASLVRPDGVILPSIDFIYPVTIILDDIKRAESEWIFISGGEPTCSNLEDLVAFIKEIKNMGKKVGVSTNGTNPEAICELLNWIDYVAMDIKGDIGTYNNIVAEKGISGSDIFMNIINSWSLLRDAKSYGDFDYEIRTTAFLYFIDRPFIDFISPFFVKGEKWIFQVYRPTKDMLDKSLNPSDPFNHEDFAKDMATYAKTKCAADISIRNV